MGVAVGARGIHVARDVVSLMLWDHAGLLVAVLQRYGSDASRRMAFGCVLAAHVPIAACH